MGQKKTCFIYRFIALGTMEEAIYKRQVTKISMSKRVVDQQQVERHFKRNDLDELYSIENIEPVKSVDIKGQPNDHILSHLLKDFDKIIYNFHLHDSLLKNDGCEILSVEEKQLAWDEYQTEPSTSRSQNSMRFPSLQIAPNSLPVPSMDIYGFSTDDLLAALTSKAQKDTGKSYVAEQIPSLLAQFHTEMANGVFDVSLV